VVGARCAAFDRQAVTAVGGTTATRFGNDALRRVRGNRQPIRSRHGNEFGGSGGGRRPWSASLGVAADLPPIVRAVQAVGLLIREGEIDSLPPDELRVRMHALLEALDYELGAFLEPPD